MEAQSLLHAGHSSGSFPSYQADNTTYNPRGRFVVLTVLTNVAATAAIVWGMFVVAQEYLSAQINWSTISVYQIASGALFCQIIRSSLALYRSNTAFFMDKVNDWFETFGIVVYENLFNIWDNLNSNLALGVLAGVRQAFVGYLVWGSVWNIYENSDKILKSRLEEKDREVVNPTLSPAYNNYGGKALEYIFYTLGAIALKVVAAKVTSLPEGAGELLDSCGSMILLQFLGYFFADKVLQIWKGMELRRNTSADMEQSQIGRRFTPGRLQAIRGVVGVVQETSTKLLCVLPLFIQRYKTFTLLSLGFLFGCNERYELERTQCMTKEDLQAWRVVEKDKEEKILADSRPPESDGEDALSEILREASVNRKEEIDDVSAVSPPDKKTLQTTLAAKVYQVSGVILAICSVGLLTYGATQTPVGPERVNVGILIGTLAGAYSVGQAVMRFFVPGESKGNVANSQNTEPGFASRFATRCMNEMMHRLRNPFIFNTSFFILKQFIGQLNSQDLDQAKGFNLLAGRASSVMWMTAFAYDFVTGGYFGKRVGLTSLMWLAAAVEIGSGYLGFPLVPNL